MLNKTPKRARTSVGRQQQCDSSSVDQVKKRLDTWRKAVDRSREVYLEHICFLIHLEILDDPTQEKWRKEIRKDFLEHIRRRHNVPQGTVRQFMVDPVSELTERVPRALSRATYVDAETFEPDYAAVQDLESIKAVFNYFGLNPEISAHRGFFLAIVTDVYLNTPVPGRPPGAGKRWDNDRYRFLGAVLDILKSRLPNASLTELAITIQKALPGKYRNENPDSFRKRLGEARRKFERLMQEDPLSASRWLLVGARALDADNQEPHAFDARSRLGNKFADFY